MGNVETMPPSPMVDRGIIIQVDQLRQRDCATHAPYSRGKSL